MIDPLQMSLVDMPMHLGLRRAAPIVLSALLTLAGVSCAGQDDSPPPSVASTPPQVATASELVQTAARAMTSLSTVQLVGDLAIRGQHRNLEVRSDRHGNCAGRMMDRDGVVNFVVTKTATYLSGDATYWKRTAPTEARRLTRLSDRGWVRFPDESEFREHCDVSARLLALLDDPGGFERVHTPGFGTLPTDTLSKRDATGTTRVQIAVDAPHYVLNLVRTTRDGKTSVDFKPDDTTELFVPGPSEIAGSAGAPLPHTGY